MSTTQIIYNTKMWQPEPKKILVESIPVKEGIKLSVNKTESIQKFSWEDLLGLSPEFNEEDEI